MLFTSCTFLFVFIPLTLLAYFLLRNIGARNFVLTAASLLFYTWGEMSYCWVMLAVITTNYLAALAIDSTEKPGLRKLLLTLTAVANLSILAWFKYAGFFAANANSLLTGWHMPTLNIGTIHLPLGISFFVFHSLSYVIDVFRRTARAQRSLANMALYISFFPQLVAGPIVRYHEINDQLTERQHTLDKAAEGIRRFVTGLSKKMLIANALALTADKIYALPVQDVTTPLAWLAALCYTFQIYFDFSGYSDMAVGLGLIFGFRLPENFNYPYIATSMRDFWQRWHMSLSNWFRDYLYIPLGGNRVPSWRVCLNLLIVFFLCGLWHGASWQFVAWGLLHGAFLGIERTFGDGILKKLWLPLRHLYVLLVVVFSWVLFRAESFGQALSFWSAMVGVQAPQSSTQLEPLFNSYTGVLLLLAVIASMPVHKLFDRLVGDGVALDAGRFGPVTGLRVAWVMTIFLLALTEVAAGSYNPFIYFRF